MGGPQLSLSNHGVKLCAGQGHHKLRVEKSLHCQATGCIHKDSHVLSFVG